MKRIKVALATHFPRELDRPKGGVESVSVILARALADCEDLDIHIVTFNSDKPQKTIEKHEAVTVHRLPELKGSTLLNALGRGRKILQQYLHEIRADLVHAHDTYGIMVKGLQNPRVFTVHGFIFEDTLVSEKKMAWLRSKMWKLVETSAWADQPNIISISPYVRERLTGITKGRIFDIDNPIDESFFQQKREERKGIIFSAAVISPRKNTLYLVRAVHNLKQKGVNCQLRLAGPVVNEEYGQRLKNEIKSLGIGENVTILGSVSLSQIKRELSEASVFALVSLEENSPLVIEEAMAVGVPVVTSNRCGMPYMVRDGETGFLVDPRDVYDISRRLEQLLRDTPLRVQFGELARKIALDRFHPRSVADKTRKVYLDILERHKR